MKNNTSARPEDIIADGLDSTLINGTLVGKGSIAAFLVNIERLAHPNNTEAEKAEIIKTMKELAPALIAVGLHQHVQFRNPEIEQLLVDVQH